MCVEKSATLGRTDFCFGGGVHWRPLARLPPKEGSCDENPQINPGASRIFNGGGRQGRLPQGAELGGGGGGTGGVHLLRVRVHLGQTLTRNKCEYWDRAGGGGNISYGAE